MFFLGFTLDFLFCFSIDFCPFMVLFYASLWIFCPFLPYAHGVLILWHAPGDLLSQPWVDAA